MRQDFNQEGAVFVNSPQGNVGSVIVSCPSSDGSAELVEALGAWLGREDPSRRGYAEVAGLHSALSRQGVGSARGFLKEHADAIATGLASSTLWELVKTVFSC